VLFSLVLGQLEQDGLQVVDLSGDGGGVEAVAVGDQLSLLPGGRRSDGQ
jgi:hypothetical protein